MKKKYLLLIALTLLLAVALIACSDHQENKPAGELIRLHIIANSDSQEDQDVKYKVRDAVLEKFGPELAGLKNAQQAKDFIAARLSEIDALASGVLQENGDDYSAASQMGIFNFPDRSYAGQIVPAGEYQALKITLGQGGGQNWWCVMYPPLCMVSFGGDVDMEEYIRQVKEFAQLEGEDASLQLAPRSPIRSALWDKFGDSEKWDEFITLLVKKSK